MNARRPTRFVVDTSHDDQQDADDDLPVDEKAAYCRRYGYPDPSIRRPPETLVRWDPLYREIL